MLYLQPATVTLIIQRVTALKKRASASVDQNSYRHFVMLAHMVTTTIPTANPASATSTALKDLSAIPLDNLLDFFDVLIVLNLIIILYNYNILIKRQFLNHQFYFQCPCKYNYAGQFCEVCADGYYSNECKSK